jgi:hypothetical protein
MILGLSRHLGAYAAGSAKAALAQLEFAGHVFEMAWRLRGSGVSSARRVEAIGIEARIGVRPLTREILPALQTLGWVDVARNEDRSLFSVDERIPPPGELVTLGASVLAIALPTEIERAALVLLRETSRQPLVVDAAVEIATDACSEQAARDAMRHLAAVNLIRTVTADDGREVVFNPNIWIGDATVVMAALRVEDARVRAEVGALVEEVADRPGIPQDHVKSTETRWVDFAVAHGLIQRSLVVTSEGSERAFLFSPHLGRDPFGVGRDDPSGHVRQLVGSMIYAATFAKYRLDSPAVFLRSLVRNGEAGDASPIGTDYPMLETAGIVRIEPSTRYYKFVLLQSDVAEEALHYLEDSGAAGSTHRGELRAQRSYVHVERERAKLAFDIPADEKETQRLIAALRDATARRGFRGR